MFADENLDIQDFRLYSCSASLSDDTEMTTKHTSHTVKIPMAKRNELPSMQVIGKRAP